MKNKNKICEDNEKCLHLYNWDLNQYVCKNCGSIVLMEEEDELDSYYKPEKKPCVRKFKESRSQ